MPAAAAAADDDIIDAIEVEGADAASDGPKDDDAANESSAIARRRRGGHAFMMVRSAMIAAVVVMRASNSQWRMKRVTRLIVASQRRPSLFWVHSLSLSEFLVNNKIIEAKSAMDFALLKKEATEELVGVPKNKIRVCEKNKIWLSNSS